MDPLLFPRGLLLGLSIAAPVGPIGVLCIRRSLAEGWRTGFVSGLGAATADGFYGAVAAFGLTAITSLLVAGQFWLRLGGGAFLVYLGVRTLLSKPKPLVVADTIDSPAARVPRGLAAYGSTLGLTLTNPATILSFVAIFAGLGVGAASGGYAGPALLVLGVFCGSALWWLFLAGTLSALRSRFRPGGLVWVNRLSGVILLGFGLLAMLSVLR
jgi:threonine/homoserine/homoserine lactone efflux protein